RTGKRIHRATIFGDYDNDGKIDFYVVNNGEESYDEDSDRHGVLFHNDSPDKNWLKVKLQGSTSNRDAFGTKLKLVAGNKTQIREHVSGEGYFSSNAQEVHFGLGDAEIIDSLSITWPNGKTQEITDIKPNQTLTVVEDSCD
ncbi:MAG TPA: hypothetical protein EYM90_05840, partial [Phycisphaerales bacterium]|nr:hypothetical protein [Phycisphaerales bacterium]